MKNSGLLVGSSILVTVACGIEIRNPHTSETMTEEKKEDTIRLDQETVSNKKQTRSISFLVTSDTHFKDPSGESVTPAGRSAF